MAKITNKNSYTSIIKLLKAKLKKSKKKFFSQDDIFKFIEKKKLLVSEEGADELLKELINSKIIKDQIDAHDFDDVSRKDLNKKSGLKGNDKEVNLDDIDYKSTVSDEQLKNTLTETDDIVK
jgi:RNA polymerase primary sigma factor